MSIHITYLIAALLLTTFGQLCYKLFFQRKNKMLFALTVLCFVFTPFCSYKALMGLSLDTVYMATSLTIVMVLAGSVIFLKEEIKSGQLIGAGLIILGIILYNL